MTKNIGITTAIISASNPKGLERLVPKLQEENNGLLIVATGGTLSYLAKKGVTKDIVHIDHYPENKKTGLTYTKTLCDPVIAGIMAGNDPEKLKALEKQGYRPIELVVMNPYPLDSFTSETPFDQVMEKVDVGMGLVAAAMKNPESRIVLSNPDQYEGFINHLDNNGGKVSYEMRRSLIDPARQMIVDHFTALKKFTK